MVHIKPWSACVQLFFQIFLCFYFSNRVSILCIYKWECLVVAVQSEAKRKKLLQHLRSINQLWSQVTDPLSVDRGAMWRMCYYVCSKQAWLCGAARCVNVKRRNKWWPRPLYFSRVWAHESLHTVYWQEKPLWNGGCLLHLQLCGKKKGDWAALRLIFSSVQTSTA